MVGAQHMLVEAIYFGCISQSTDEWHLCMMSLCGVVTGNSYKLSGGCNLWESPLVIGHWSLILLPGLGSGDDVRGQWRRNSAGPILLLKLYFLSLFSSNGELVYSGNLPLKIVAMLKEKEKCLLKNTEMLKSLGNSQANYWVKADNQLTGRLEYWRTKATHDMRAFVNIETVGFSSSTT